MEILVVFHGDLHNPSSGSDVRVHNLTKRLADQHSIVTIEAREHAAKDPAFDIDERYYFSLHEHAGSDLGFFFSDINPSYLQALRGALKKHELDIVHKHYPYGLTTAAILSERFNGPTIIYDSHNVNSDKVRQLELPWYRKLVAVGLTSLTESLSCRFADHVVAVSKRDRETFYRGRYPVDREDVSVIPSGAETLNLDSMPPSEECKRAFNLGTDSPVVVFHGDFTSQPNREAANIINEDIVPALDHDVTVVLAGRDAPEFVHPSIQTLGFVDDLDMLLKGADAAVVPLQRGGGTKLKMFDYMKAGLPIATTNTGAEGIAISHGTHALVAPTIDELINYLNALLVDPSLREQLGTASKRLVERKYDWDVLASRLMRLYERL